MMRAPRAVCPGTYTPGLISMKIGMCLPREPT